MAIYGYIRVSTLEQLEGGSLTNQEAQVRNAAVYIGKLPAGMTVFQDSGVSGCTSLFDRPGSKKMIDVAKAGDTIIAAKLDRMFRDVREALEWLEYFKKHDIDLVLCDMGLDPVTGSGVSRLLFSILASMAEFERERIRERSAEGRALKRSNGGHIGGRPPFGYMIEGSGKAARCVVDPALAEAVAFLRDCWSAGATLRDSSRLLSEKHGVRVSFSQVGRLFRKFNDEA